MKTLFIDLSSNLQSLAVTEGTKTLALFPIDSKVGEEDLMIVIEKLLKKATMTLKDLDRIASTTGPGGFMSLRVGISLANALADSLNVPLAGVHLSDLWAARLHPYPPAPSPGGRRGAQKPAILKFARSMRKKPTEAESLLWEKLKNRKNEFKFRRQHPIQSRILDFYCDEAKLGIEIDGDSHSLVEQQQYDGERTEALGEFGIRILRFKNDAVLKNIEGVLTKIKDFLRSPLPPGEGLGVREHEETQRKEPRVLWIHSTKQNLMFVRGIGKGAEAWKEPTLEKMEDLKAMLRSETPFIGELIESQQKELPMLKRKEDLTPIEDVLPEFLDGLAYEKKSLLPWYGRGA